MAAKREGRRSNKSYSSQAEKAYQKFKDRLTEYADKHDYSQKIMAQMLNVTVDTYSGIVKPSGIGRRDTILFMYDLCKKLKYDADYLLNLQDDPLFSATIYKEQTGLDDNAIEMLRYLHNQDLQGGELIKIDKEDPQPDT
ncbi:MAG: hypothetical protein IJT32_00715, partial [Lachnospiraceae bacterium]|nr:hypothetical protein [Lachnospiraceae bacterium]